jgi:uncharacterized protein DUF4232
MSNLDRDDIPTSTSDMLVRTRRRAEQIRGRRRGALAAVAGLGVVVAIAVPVALASGGHGGRVVGVTGAPTTQPAATTSTTVTPTSVTMPAVTVPTSVPSSSPTTVRPAPSPTTTTASIAPGAACATSQLHAQLANGSGAAGSVGYDLVLVNAGATACTLRGYPGVSYVTGSGGTTVGAAAMRDAVSPVALVTLAPGHSAHATLIEVDSLNYPSDSCQLTAAAGLRIYPPNQTAALFIPQSTQACGNPNDNVLQVGPVVAS